MTRILSLDYSPEILEILSGILQAAGCEVLTTTDSYEAWALLQTVPVDLVTHDLILVDIDGHEFLGLMRTDKHLGSIPVLIVSARVDYQEILAAYKEGAFGYVTKPFSRQQILNWINAAMLDSGKSLLSIPGLPKVPIERPDIEKSIEALKDMDPSVRLSPVNNL